MFWKEFPFLGAKYVVSCAQNTVKQACYIAW